MAGRAGALPYTGGHPLQDGPVALIGPFSRLFGFLSQDIAIDLGTANTLVMVRGRGIVIIEPSIVAIDRISKRILAIGEDAQRMVGRTPSNIIAVRPLRDGVISDFEVTERMLSYFIRAVQERAFLAQPRLVVGIPSGVTEVEKRAVHDAALSAGARSCYLIEEPLAAAIGSGLPVMQPSGCMVVDIGGGTTEVAVLSLSGVVYADTVRVGGDRFDESIVNFVRRTQGTLIGEAIAERIKQEIGAAYKQKEPAELKVRGHNLQLGVPRTFTLTSNDILEALNDPLTMIVQSVKNALEATPPELSADIAETGMVLTGGGALLKDLDVLLAEETGLPVIVAEDPLTCVARGGGKVLDAFDSYVDILWTE